LTPLKEDEMQLIGLARPLGPPRWRALFAAVAISAGAFGSAAAQVVRAPAYRQPSRLVRGQMARAGTVDTVLLSYAHGLVFDTSSAAIDGQWLMNADTSRGPYAVLKPRSGSSVIPHGFVLAGDIMARLHLSASYLLTLPRQHGPDFTATLPRGVSYLWVDSTASGWRIVLMPDSLGGLMQVLPCHHYPGAQVEAARFKVAGPAGFDDTVCFPCNTGWCCAEM
jgi:hypothetical protein